MVIIHDVKQSIYSILTDPVLNQDKNYYFKDFLKPKLPLDRDNSTILDFFNGTSFRNAEKRLLSDKENEMIVPICLFIDKTHATENGRFMCEPVSMCLMLYDLETRNKPEASRTIGYIINQADVENKDATPYMKLLDYHECLGEILRPLLKFQLSNGFKWRIPFKGTIFEMTIKTPILFIAGDNEGMDKLAGRYGSRTNVKCICRYCDIPLLQAGNPEYEFKYHTNQKMVDLVKKTKNSNCLNYCIIFYQIIFFMN